ncbi:uncharacterized protein LOC142912467 isoform X2 [Petromyzon marinus]|uniref:uncharacterized protein LOC142912467 isoform X2 n=1 Tax=Petromyzon marinus TaxID=7757 RepID=UPI003F6F53C3
MGLGEICESMDNEGGGGASHVTTAWTYSMSITIATFPMMIMVVMMAMAGLKVIDACDEQMDEALSVHYGESVLLNCSLPLNHKVRRLKSMQWKKTLPNKPSSNILYYEESMDKVNLPTEMTFVGNTSSGDGSLVLNMSELDRAGVYWCELKAKVGVESPFSKEICVTIREADTTAATAPSAIFITVSVDADAVATTAQPGRRDWAEMAAFIAGSVVLVVILMAVLVLWGYHRNQQRIVERFIYRASVTTTGPYENVQPSKNFQRELVYEN